MIDMIDMIETTNEETSNMGFKMLYVSLCHVSD